MVVGCEVVLDDIFIDSRVSAEEIKAIFIRQPMTSMERINGQ